MILSTCNLEVLLENSVGSKTHALTTCPSTTQLRAISAFHVLLVLLTSTTSRQSDASLSSSCVVLAEF